MLTTITADNFSLVIQSNFGGHETASGHAIINVIGTEVTLDHNLNPAWYLSLL